MTNISFNNKNYSISDEALAASLAELRQHLFTNMSGSGAKIVLDGTAYNIDSTKLSTATAEFVTHLGTVSGSGYKVKVNGVEYGVASDKMAGAVADLEAVLGNLNSGGGGGGSANLPEIGISAEDCTWEEITAISAAGKAEEYFNLGDTKTVTLTDGTVVEMQIVAFNADDKADGSGKAAITWISKGVVTKRIMNQANDYEALSNGWVAYELRTWLQNDFYDTLPSDVRDCIVPVNKTYAHYINLGGGSFTYETHSCEDTVWIPSYREIYGNDSNDIRYETSGVDYATFFSDDEHRDKYYGSKTYPDAWWLRTTCNGDNDVHLVGGGSYYLHYEYGVVPCFCTGATSSTPSEPTEEILEGDGQQFHKFAPTALTFRSTAPLNELQEVQINGVTVDPSNYTTEEGSTIITLPIEYLNTLDVDNYEITVVSDSKSAKGGFTVVQPELNEYGFYYNQPYGTFVSHLGGTVAVFIHEGGTLDVFAGGAPASCSYTLSGNNMTVTNTPMGTLNCTISDDGMEVYCTELGASFILANELIVADDDFLYVYDESLNGYSVTPIDAKKSVYGAIKTGIYDKDTVVIPFNAFYQADNLVIAPMMPDSIKEIGRQAFCYCSALTKIIIPNSVESIGNYAFDGCSDLTNVTFNGTTAQWSAITKGTDWNLNVPATYVQCSDGQVSLV